MHTNKLARARVCGNREQLTLRTESRHPEVRCTKEGRILIDAGRAVEKTRSDIAHSSHGSQTGGDSFTRARKSEGRSGREYGTHAGLAKKLAGCVDVVGKPTSGGRCEGASLAPEDMV